MIYKANKRQVSYGEAIGILLMESYMPFPPGDVGNATTFPFPVRYQVVRGASVEALIVRADPSLLEPFVNAGMELAKEGVRAITGDCGYMVVFQKELARRLPVPVFMSSLLQVPFISRMLKPEQEVGVIVANSRALTDKHLKAAGIDESIHVRVAGMEDQPYFRRAILDEGGELDFDRVEKEVVNKSRKLVAKYRKIGAILLECSDLPPYAAAVQEAVRLPVFDFVTMINYVFSAVVRQRFQGFL